MLDSHTLVALPLDTRASIPDAPYHEGSDKVSLLNTVSLALCGHLVGSLKHLLSNA